MNLSEARENLSSQLGRYFGEIALSNHIVKNKIEVGLSLVDSLVKDPANCKEYTLTAKTLQFTLQISQKMGLQDMVMFDGLVIDTIQQMHEGSTNVHSADCASAMPTDALPV